MAIKHTRRAMLALVIGPFFLFDCGLGGPTSKLPGSKPAACDLDLKNPEAIMKAELGLERKLEERVKASLAASARLEKLGEKIEGEVTTACSALARDLGASDGDVTPQKAGPGKEAEAACGAAAKMIGKLKAKLGADAVMTVEMEAPACEASLESAVDCVAECDADIKQGDLKADCVGGKAAGKCKGKCDGSCTVKAGAKCEGSCAGNCEGKCDSDIRGTCEGKCDGQCDGKDSKGKCEGRCDGKCSGKVKASCSGKCEGSCSASCEIAGKADCEGTCTGGCSVELEEPKCVGTVKLPEAKPECKANCEAKLDTELQCKPAKVAVKITGAKNAQLADKLKRSLEAHLPALAKVTLRMQDHLGELTKDVKTSLKGVQAAMTSGGGAAMSLGGCVAASLAAQVDAAASINLSVKASVKVTGSAGAG